MPILFSKMPTYDVLQGGEFFEYLIFQLLLLQKTENNTFVPMYINKRLALIGANQVPTYFEQIGQNTNYIIHPEEILADNFSLLVMKTQNVPSPNILYNMDKLLKTH